MDVPRPSSAARRSTLSIPTKPDASLAEWTSKIKELQKQVDEDEEAETRRLEAEIAASRQARLRRSTGYASRSSSVDIPQSALAALAKVDDRSHTPDSPFSSIDKQRNQEDALKKLTGDRPSAKPSAHSAPSVPVSQSKATAEPISLAAFIGGRATGPRLTKHAPQQDAHDPTQFEQRTNISAPHPVFGRGGVAMPGMTGHGSASVVSRAIREQESHPAASSTGTPQRDRRISTPTSVRSVVEKAEERTVLPSYTGSSTQTAIRQRTISTPTGAAPARASPAPETFAPKPKPDPIPRPLSHSSNAHARPITPHASSASPAPYSTSKSPAPRPVSAASQRVMQTPPPPSPTHSPKPSITTPGLARPIQPTPRHSLGSPQMPPSQNPSPAFLKPPPAKEPTPSLSRLQGRGFVQNMVKKTSELSATPEGSPTPDRKDGGRRQSSVLDRWQFSNATGSPAPPPVISPKPIPMRKSFTADPSSPTTSSYSVPLKADNTGRTLKSKSSLPTLPTMRTGNSAVGPSSMSESGYGGPHPKLGSAKTVITYIQPARTGDQPIPQYMQHEDSTPDVDELGMRTRTRTTSGGLVQERGALGLPAKAGQPLSHPTKDRAKKPRKGKSAPAAAASNLTTIREGSPVRDGHKAQHEGAATSLQTPQSFASVRTASPVSQYPSPPATAGKAANAVTPPTKPIVPTKPTLDVRVPATTAAPEKSPVSPLVPPKPARSPSVSPPQSGGQKPPASPAKHTRIPSTGNRATVMDVAQVFNEVLQSTSPTSVSPVETKQLPPPPPAADTKPTTVRKDEPEEEESWEPPSVKNLVANWGPRSTGNGAPAALSAPALERRKSSYEKYSAFVLPPLKEEKTPVSSPAGTLARGTAPIVAGAVTVKEEEVTEDVTKAEKDAKVENVVVTVEAVEAKPQPRSDIVHLAHADEPLPHVDVDALYQAPRAAYTPDPDLTTVSVDVLSIVGNTANAISKDPSVFYDGEFLAIVHRAKARSSGLVQTKVWGWLGRHAKAGERETQKLQELARRYGTSPATVRQTREPVELVAVLGGQLALRQGTRTHWSADNTAMHVVRSLQGVIYIDEVDLNIKNLCSGYSYCISILDTYYVWHGRGSVASEQQAALKYAQSLASSPQNIIELNEDESQADEMFWMVLGQGEYAKADYWQWRATAPVVDPRVWVIDTQHSDGIVRPVTTFPSHPEFGQSIHLVDCIWELFVLVGDEARGRRLDIRLALSLADALARKASPARPFTPTVHALIFPTQIPTDLLLTFRELEEAELNGGNIPDHMNLIPAGDAITDLRSTTWTSAALGDHTMLPLGVTPPHFS
ncbi:hypothetical protein C8Q77DRAFT_1057913 [Trametes polyzona]|nr:hypothetical protein C8Q77DRAFT_1057913 [Trametes polyzona]